MANPGIELDVRASVSSLGTFESQLKKLVEAPLPVKIKLDNASADAFKKQLKDLGNAINDAVGGSGSGGGGKNNALEKQVARLLEIEALQKRIAEQLRKADGLGMASTDSVKALKDAYATLEVLEVVVKDNDEAAKKYSNTISDVRSKLSSATTIIKDYAAAEEQVANALKEETKAADADAKAHAEEQKQLLEIESVRKRINALLQKASDYGIDSSAVESTRQMAGELDNLQVGTKECTSALGEMKTRLAENENSINRGVDVVKAYESAEKEAAKAAREQEKADKEAAAATREHTKATEDDASAGNKRAGILQNVGKELQSFVGRLVSFQSIVRVIREMAKASIELDSAFTQLKIVTGATEAEMAKFERSAYKLAKSLGQSATDVAKSIEVFSRLGYNLTDASKLAEYSGIMSNVASVSNEEATTGLTSIIKGFNMQVSEAEHVSDVLIQVGQKYAVSAGEIMEAFEKSGAALNATGTSFEKAAGLIAAANASVQNAGTVGVALKTVSARIRKSEAELEELGEDVSDLAEGFSKYAEEIKALTGFNIMVDGTTDTFKDLYDIMEGISKVWDKLTDTQRARVSEILGGTRQLQVISSILGNWGDAVGAYEDAMNSAGVATQANATYMDSAQAHLNQFKATFQELAANVVQSDLVKELTDTGTAFLELANSVVTFVDSAGGLTTVLGVFGTIQAFSLGPVVGGIAASVTAVYALISAFKSYREELIQAKIDAAESAKANIGGLTELAARYEELAGKTNLTEDEKREQSQITDELIEKYGIEKVKLNELAAEYGNVKDAISEVINEEISDNLVEMTRATESYLQKIKDAVRQYRGGFLGSGNMRAMFTYDTLGGDADIAKQAKAALAAAGYGIETDTVYLGNGGRERGFTLNFSSQDLDTIDGITSAYNELGEAMKVVEDTVGHSNEVYYRLHDMYQQIGDQLDAYYKHLEDINGALVVQAYRTENVGKSLPTTQAKFDEMRENMIQAVMASEDFASSTDDAYKEASEAVDTYLQSLGKFSEFYGDGESVIPPSVEQTSKQVQELQKLSDALSTLKTDYEILAKAESEMKDGGGLSPDTIKSMADATDDYLDYLYEENGVIKLNTEAWNEFINAQKQDSTEAIRNNIEVLKQQRIELEATLNELMYATAPSEDRDTQIDIVQRQLAANGKALAENVAALDIYNAALRETGTVAAETAEDVQSLTDAISQASSDLTALADLQAAVSESYTISANEALKYAEVFPEILAQSKLTADGQIQLNEEVVNSFIESARAEINATIEKKIAELEAEKEIIEAKKAYAEAKLAIVKQAAEAEGEAAYQTAKYMLDTADELVASLIEEGNEETAAYAEALSNMSSNTEEFDDVVRETAEDMQYNLGVAADNAAQSISDNMTNAGESVKSLALQIHNAARQLEALSRGDVVEYTDTGTGGAGGAGYKTGSMRVHSKSFSGTATTSSKSSLSLKRLTLDLEDEINGYAGEIARIDGAIDGLRNILGATLDKFGSGSGSGGRSGSGGGGGSGGSSKAEEIAKEVQAVDEEVIKGYDALIQQYQKAIEVTQGYLDQAIATDDLAGVQEHTQKIIEYYRQMQETVHDEAEYYRSLGYDETSEEIQKLSELWWEYAENIGSVTAEAYQKLADNAKSTLDEIKSAYDTLKSAAQEYAESGFITVNTLESIISMGVQYLAFLYDENGQLVINEQSIQRVIAARTEQYAVESALAYVAQVRQAAEAGDITTLNQLTQATQITTGATWDLVYAQMALINLSDEQYNGMLRNVQALQSLTASAVSSIGQETGQVRRQLENESKALDTIMNATKSMIKQENQAQINATKQAYQSQISAAKEAGNAQVEALRNQKKAYDDQIEQKKKLLDATKKQIEREETLADKIKKIAKLQAKITQLSLDDSRDAKAQRTKLEEELADLQKDLADTQRDYEIEAQKDALTAEKEAYDNAMDAQISAAQKAADAAVSAMQSAMDQQVSILQNSLNSEEKLYQAALSRIDGGWDSLYGDLKAWNSEYGNMVESDLVSAWDAASAAVQRYGSYAAAVTGVQNEINGLGNSNTVGTSNAYGSSQINATSVRAVINQMRANSEKWKTAASQAEKDRLHEDTVKLAQNLSRFGVRVHYEGSSGKWIIDSDTNNPSNVGRWLYEVYHKGGIVGQTPTLQQNETMAKLQNGEMVLTQDQSGVLYKIVDFVSVLSDKLGKILDSSAISRLFDGSDNSALASMLRNSAAGTGAMPGVGNITVEHMEVSAPIHVVQKLDDDDIREHAKAIGSFAAEYIKEGFTKRGVKATASLLG